MGGPGHRLESMKRLHDLQAVLADSRDRALLGLADAVSGHDFACRGSPE